METRSVSEGWLLAAYPSLTLRVTIKDAVAVGSGLNKSHTVACVAGSFQYNSEFTPARRSWQW